MNILQVFSSFSITFGGGTVDLIYKISRALKQRGHEVTIYTSDFGLEQEYIDSLHEIKVFPFHSFVNVPGLYFSPDLLSEIAKNLKYFDIIHLHMQRSFQNILLHHYAQKYGVPYLIDAHGSTPMTKKKSLKQLYDLFFGNRISKDCSGFIAESDLGVNEYKELGIEDDKIVLIPPPFPVEDFDDLPLPGTFRKRYGIKEKHIVMFFGRINWIKGIDFLVESFHELTRSRNDILLTIVGPDDGYRSELETLINKLGLEKKVLFTGLLNKEYKLAALVDANMIVQTSRYEQGAWAPFEAVLCGTPIIVSGHTGAGEDVKRIDAGYLVELDNKKELIEAISTILADPSNAREKAKNAAAYIRQHRSMVKRIEDYENLYLQCIEENKHKRGQKK